MAENPDNPFILEYNLHVLAANAALKERDYTGYTYHVKQHRYFKERMKNWETLNEICEKVEGRGK